MMDPASEIARAISDRERFLLCLHRSPDGDSVGSSLAMGRAIGRMGKSATLVSTDPVPRAYHFLDGSELIQDPGSVDGEWDAALVIDCGSIDRAGRARRLVQSCPLVINIDHHETNSRFGHINWVDPGRAAAGEMIMDLLDVMGLDLDSAQATALYTALATDTGFFAYPSTTARVFSAAAELVERGADPGLVSMHVIDNRSLASLKVLGVALGSLIVDESKTLAWMSLTRADLEGAGASPEDVNGIVNYARSVAGVEVGLLFVEQENGQVKVGLRSRTADVSTVAEALGGGGHPRASGCIVSGPLDDAIERVLTLAREAALSER